MLNKNNIQILQETFSVGNVPFSDKTKKVFISIQEDKSSCVVYFGGIYKCLRVETKYSPENIGILQKLSSLFTQYEISIFAFTSIDYGYFFFEERFQNCVESNILDLI